LLAWRLLLKLFFSLLIKMSAKTLVVIVGPTAVGKTDFAVRLGEYFKTEIISADSRQFYQELEIGTAKPTAMELGRVKHHFINSKSITEEYDAGTYGREARFLIDRLFEKYDVVIMCGGSGLYIKAALEGFDDLPEVPAEIRAGIATEYESRGLNWLQQEVAEHDPDYFDVVDQRNPQRLMRSLEVIRATGRSFSSFHKKKKVVLPFSVIKIGLTLERGQLYERIDKRMDDMIQDGLFEEAEKFYAYRNSNALQTVGYLEAFGLREGRHDREEAVRLMKRNSRRYAKRQHTWFRKDPEIKWFDPANWQEVISFIKARISAPP
jgi:tRNA dimethylallyltransferase